MADKKLHVLYIPGLGDTAVTGQRMAVRTWRLWDVRAEVLQMYWDNEEPWEEKLERLLSSIDKLAAQDIKVALVGSSAGATAVINAYALRKSRLVGCVLIAGKVNNPTTIGATYRQRNPAFIRSAEGGEKALETLTDLDRKRILSCYGIFDGIVARNDSYVAGARNQVLPAIGHAFIIGTQLIFGAPYFLHFLKALAQKDSTA